MFKEYYLKYRNFVKKNSSLIIFILLFIFFFTFPVLILYDSAHYMNFVEIFEGKQSFSNWDIVRGPVFPILIFLSNKLFGKTSVGLLFMNFFFYLIMLFVSRYILDFLSIKNRKKQMILYALFFFLIILNPILFGYYHTLLTEGIAITLAILSSLLAWKLLTFSKDKNPYSLPLAIYFIIMTPVSWFLKQPYLSTVLFPLGVATVIQLFLTKNIKQKLSVALVLVLSLLSLFFSVKLWNVFLQEQNVDMNTDRNVTITLGNQLLETMPNIKINTEDGEMDMNIEIVDRDAKVVGVGSVKKNEEGFVNTKDAIMFILKTFVKHPLQVIDSYFTNYLALINIHSTYTSDGVSYYIKDRVWDASGCVENCAIAISLLDKKSNVYYMSEEMYLRVQDYEQYVNSPFVLRKVLRLFVKSSILIFNISLLLLPFIFIVSIIYWIIQKQKNDEFKQRAFALSVILLGFSFLHLLLHAVTGAVIDRYATPSYITTILGYISFYVACCPKKK